MKNNAIATLNPGDILGLKPERALAYGMKSAKVTVNHVKERAGYSTPWIVAADSSGVVGYYKPSDFK